MQNWERIYVTSSNVPLLVFKIIKTPYPNNKIHEHSKDSKQQQKHF